MIDFSKIYEKIVEEDAVVAAGDAGTGEVVSGDSTVDTDITVDKGISADDVLGKCDHHSDGYLGAKCFHVPKNALGKGKVLKRWQELPGTKKKKKKQNPYEDGMTTVTEEIDVADSMKNLTDDDIYDVIIRYYGIDAESLGNLISIAQLAGTQRFFIKFKASYRSSNMKNYFIEVAYENGKLAPLKERRKVMTANEAKKIFADDAELNIVWSAL